MLAEEKLNAVNKSGGGRSWAGKSYGGGKNWRTENKQGAESTTASKNSESAKSGRPNGAKSVGGDEIEERREKGLCFTCDEKYVPGHVCKNRVLKLLYVEEISEADENKTEQDETEEEILWQSSFKSIHLYSVAGITSKGSFMLKGKIGGKEVIVLIDCGATHNFISMKIVTEYNLEVEDTPPCWVNIGNGKGY